MHDRGDTPHLPQLNDFYKRGTTNKVEAAAIAGNITRLQNHKLAEAGHIRVPGFALRKPQRFNTNLTTSVIEGETRCQSAKFKLRFFSLDQ
jgi:hypothetical protein